jgi:hypothetical protein
MVNSTRPIDDIKGRARDYQPARNYYESEVNLDARIQLAGMRVEQ